MTALDQYGQLDEGVTLTGLAGSFRVLRVSVDRPHDSLLLSLTQCSKVSRHSSRQERMQAGLGTPGESNIVPDCKA
jgi:hypothetical protein